MTSSEGNKNLQFEIEKENQIPQSFLPHARKKLSMCLLDDSDQVLLSVPMSYS
jgi:hypothetical protein